MQNPKKPQLWLGFTTLTVFGFLYSWLWGLNRADELWFFYLAKLAAEGRLPYLDFAWHVFPLSLFLAAAALKVFTAHVFVLKALMATVFALQAMLAWKLAELLQRRDDAARLFFLALMLLAPPIPGSAYGPLAYLCLLGAALASLHGLEKPTWQLWLAAGSLAGLATACKYNVGLLVLAAVVLARWIAGRRGLALHLAAAGAGFALVVGANLLPVWRSGAWNAFRDQVFGTKRFYLATAATLPLQGQLLHHLPLPVVLTSSENALRVGLRAGSFLCVPLGALALAKLWRGGKMPRRRLAVFGFFFAAGGAGAFPRFDSEHVLLVVPLALVPLFLLAREKLPRRWLGRLAALAAAAAALVLLLPVASLRAGVWQPAKLPYLEGARVGVEEAQRIETTLRFARGIPPQGRILFLGPYASFYYLTSGVQPPTPQVFPLVTELGNVGQQQLVEALEKGGIDWVCMQRWSWALRPAKLEAYVEQHLILEESHGECSWWRNPRAAAR